MIVDCVHVRAVRNSHFDNPPGHPQDNGTHLSYRFDYQGYGVGYMGDTGPSDAVAALERNVDLLVSEVTERGTGETGGRPGRRAAAMRGRAGAIPQQDNQKNRPGPQSGPPQNGALHFQHQHLSPETAASPSGPIKV
jgi:hypothetical protein